MLAEAIRGVKRIVTLKLLKVVVAGRGREFWSLCLALAAVHCRSASRSASYGLRNRAGFRQEVCSTGIRVFPARMDSGDISPSEGKHEEDLRGGHCPESSRSNGWGLPAAMRRSMPAAESSALREVPRSEKIRDP